MNQRLRDDLAELVTLCDEIRKLRRASAIYYEKYRQTERQLRDATETATALDQLLLCRRRLRPKDPELETATAASARMLASLTEEAEEATEEQLRQVEDYLDGRDTGDAR